MNEMTAKWQRQQANQLSGAASQLNNLLVNQIELFNSDERKLLADVVKILSHKGENIRGGSPGGG